MKKGVLPYAIIAILGIVAVIIISVIGLNHRAEIAEGTDNGTEQTENGGEESGSEEGETAGGDADAVFQNNCAMCHGADLSGGAGPDLTAVGASHSADEIKEIIQNGTGSMPPVPAVQGEELEALATWLSEKQ
ncbi:c-type cytochrome [Oceanobacillus sp. FSL H7-0719]|uniref:c-type cytochrome n=1 Tax=Oceanobacillus sp. FSL H7-0719 TaxID=2954507 RepID=UPI003256271A